MKKDAMYYGFKQKSEMSVSETMIAMKHGMGKTIMAVKITASGGLPFSGYGLRKYSDCSAGLNPGRVV
jgi:hypothetical protein